MPNAGGRVDSDFQGLYTTLEERGFVDVDNMFAKEDDTLAVDDLVLSDQATMEEELKTKGNRIFRDPVYNHYRSTPRSSRCGAPIHYISYSGE